MQPGLRLLLHVRDAPSPPQRTQDVSADDRGIGCNREKSPSSRTSTTKTGFSSPTRSPSIGSPTRASHASEDRTLGERTYRPGRLRKDGLLPSSTPIDTRPSTTWPGGSQLTRCHRWVLPLRGNVLGDLPGVFLGLEQSRDGYIYEADDGDRSLLQADDGIRLRIVVLLLPARLASSLGKVHQLGCRLGVNFNRP